MEKFQKELIREHKELVIRITNLFNFIHSEKADTINKAEFANLCVQLNAMKMYVSVLEARLVNAGVCYENGNYFIPVNSIDTPDYGLDYDVDEETIEDKEDKENNG